MTLAMSDTPLNSEDDGVLLEWLESHDEPCPACGYSLRALTTGSCPECGVRLTLGVRAPHMRLGPWAAASLGCALGLGFDGVVVLVLTGVMIYARSLPPAQPFLAYQTLLSLGVVCFFGLLALIRYRRFWFRMSPRRQWVAGLGVFAAVGLLHAGAGVWLFVLLS